MNQTFVEIHRELLAELDAYKEVQTTRWLENEENVSRALNRMTSQAERIRELEQQQLALTRDLGEAEKELTNKFSTLTQQIEWLMGVTKDVPAWQKLVNEAILDLRQRGRKQEEALNLLKQGEGPIYPATYHQDLFRPKEDDVWKMYLGNGRYAMVTDTDGGIPFDVHCNVIVGVYQQDTDNQVFTTSDMRLDQLSSVLEALS